MLRFDKFSINNIFCAMLLFTPTKRQIYSAFCGEILSHDDHFFENQLKYGWEKSGGANPTIPVPDLACNHIKKKQFIFCRKFIGHILWSHDRLGGYQFCWFTKEWNGLSKRTDVLDASDKGHVTLFCQCRRRQYWVSIHCKKIRQQENHVRFRISSISRCFVFHWISSNLLPSSVYLVFR